MIRPKSIPTKILSIESSTGASDDRLDGHCQILGTLHHVLFLRVKTIKGLSPDGRYEGQAPYPEAATMYDYLAASDPGGNFQTVRVPGYRGTYVCIITPFQR